MLSGWSLVILFVLLYDSVFAHEPFPYMVQTYWNEGSSGELSLILTCADQCHEADDACSVVWSLNQVVVSNTTNLTINSRSQYGEYQCSRRSDGVVLKKELLIPPGNYLQPYSYCCIINFNDDATCSIHVGNNFTCPECLNFSVCQSDERVYFTNFITINERAIEEIYCTLSRNGMKSNCLFQSRSCSLDVSDFNFTASYVLKCPLTSNLNYHIDSLAQQVGPAEAIESCTSKSFKCALCQSSKFLVVKAIV